MIYAQYFGEFGMYGMIHRAILDFLEQNSCDDEWQKLQSHIAIGPDLMISTIVYPDEKTIELVNHAAALMDLSPQDFLRRLGQFWIVFSERGPFGHIMDFTGKNLATFIGNLNRMHQAVLLAMPNADVPSFELVESRPGELIVDYRSSRTGLEPFVTGLLEGLLRRFGHKGSVSLAERSVQPARFIVRYA